MQDAPTVEQTASRAPIRERWTRTDVIAAAAITVAGGLLRAVRLANPNRGVGDEGPYASDACWYALSSKSTCGVPREMNLEHPPLGKWLIASGVKVFGFDVTAQRLLPLVFGTLTILVVYLLARKLLHSTFGASIASGLFALDFMQFLHSRVAMLDVFLAFFVTLAFLLLVMDRDRLFAAEGGLGGIRPWRVAAAAAAGAASATKWTGLLAVIGVAFLSLVWELNVQRGRRNFFIRTLLEQGPALLLTFVLVPVGVYSLTFVGRVHGSLFAWPGTEGAWLNALWDRQAYIFRFHAHHIGEHPFASDPLSWPIARRGVPFLYFPDTRVGVRALIDTGNPVIWILSLVALAFVAFRWARRQDPRRAEGVILAGFAWAYLPWPVYHLVPYVFFTWGRSATFIWYLLPALPFMYLALGYVAVEMARKLVGRVAIAAVALFAVVAFAVYYPVIAYVPMSRSSFDARLFAFENCARPKRAPFVFFRRVTVDGLTRFERQEEPAGPHIAPKGWCWLP